MLPRENAVHRILKWRILLVCLTVGVLNNGVSAHAGVRLSGIKTEAPIPQGDWQFQVIPLKRAGNLILIEGTVDSISGNFILDTGAPYLVLNQTYFRSYQPNTASASVGVSGLSEVARTQIPRLDFGGIFYEHVDADVINLSHIEDQKKVRVLGLIGTNLFSGLQISIDLVKNQLFVYRLDSKGNPQSLADTLSSDSLRIDRIPDLQFNFNYCDEKIFIPVEINGQKMNWILDTGAETNVVDAWSKKKVIRDFVVNRRINLVGSTGEKQEILLGVMPETSVGNISFPMQQTIVTSMQELSETCSLYIDGILGYSFLSQGIFTINFVKKEFSMYFYNSIK